MILSDFANFKRSRFENVLHFQNTIFSHCSGHSPGRSYRIVISLMRDFQKNSVIRNDFKFTVIKYLNFSSCRCPIFKFRR
mmetsp:Transcript_4142/g.15625  ORF Transcript_4142/g.15625 Transcript_4142/m.15625 type:complete len:80 (+) Transcript_4142:2140-2379(+)